MTGRQAIVCGVLAITLLGSCKRKAAVTKEQPPAIEAAGPVPTRTSAPPAIADLGADDKALMERSVAATEEMAEALAANTGDCAKAATALQAVLERHKELLIAAKARNQDPAIKAYVRVTHRERVLAAMGKMMPVIEACKDDAVLANVLTSLY